MSVSVAVTVRPLAASDWDKWSELWRGYLSFYETERPPDVYESTFTRMLSGREHEFRGLVAESANGELIGLAHFVVHRSGWSEGCGKCYLQDLFVSGAARGGGAGRRLMEAVFAEADACGAAPVYWFTHEDNAGARVLYDRMGERTAYVKYDRVCH